MPETKIRGGLVLDTSVWINLLATGMVDRIVRAVGIELYVPEQIYDEITRDPISGIRYDATNHPLRASSGLVTVAKLDARELDLYFDLVSPQSVDALGDGEGAAIAMASSRQFALVIDDKKARRILRERFADVKVLWTVEILRSPAVVNSLGARVVDDCFAKAKQFGRMHIP
jgi:predicted nucleic acid-binding protein